MDLALNNLQWLIWHKTKPNQTNFFCKGTAVENVKQVLQVPSRNKFIENVLSPITMKVSTCGRSSICTFRNQLELFSKNFKKWNEWCPRRVSDLELIA